MSAPLERLSGRKPVRWTTILGLLLVPLTVAGVLLWGLWQPTDRLEQVTAAVVNEDKPVEVDGQLVPLGRVLASELIAGDAETNFTWVLTDAEDAKAGMDEGRYATSVTIPENFSAAATSASKGPDEVQTARIEIAESDRGRLIDSALSSIVTQTATSMLNQKLGSQFVGNVFVGMNKLHTGISDAASGAGKLAAGGTQLADGTTKLADGTTQLADGTQQLASGAGTLADGAGSLAGGAGTLADGAQQAADGQAKIADGVTEYANGARDLAKSYQEMLGGVRSAVAEFTKLSQWIASLVQELKGPTQRIANGIGTTMAGSESLKAHVPYLDAQCRTSGATPEFCNEMTDTLTRDSGQISGGIGEVQAGAAEMQERIAAAGSQPGGIGGSGGDPTKKLKQLQALANGFEQFGGGLNTFAAKGQQLATGAHQSADGAAKVAGGVSELAGGASQLAGGASELSSGTAALAAKTPELADGAKELANGAKQSAKGSKDLAKGLGAAASGIPDYSEAQRNTLADHAVTSVKAEGGSDELFNSSGVPLFAGIALWAGALAAFLVLSPLWRRTRDAARGVGAITLRSALPAIGLGALQGAIAGIVLPIALGYDLGKGAAFFGLALLAGVAFSLLVQGLSALLGGFGRFLAFALLVVAFAVGIVSTVPGPLAALGDASPIGSALGGFQAIAMDASGVGGAAVLLVLWGGLGLALTALAVARARRSRER
ncbi:YhgE/Pip domain-containing protein [Leucobacter sp. CSA2]|uniref:YhgE/Pip domain-containing protein n=1 Tax=Leucobacter edaphi TaxID=2796472 RepID=A0A934UXZ6_9MICO|nr:YhgE/Pip domain-containing protein [Leucobacter edaphi]MBK0421878.1 YhgE/Pip domain-containing protein [Leucobacter edaphi]